MEGTKKIKSTSFHQYSWNFEVETTWISLIGWQHKTSSRGVANYLTADEEFMKVLMCFAETSLLQNDYISNRRLMGSTDQADPSCFYFRISWILMEQRWFYFFHPLHFLQGLRSLKHWLLQKLSMKNFDQKFRFLIKK